MNRFCHAALPALLLAVVPLAVAQEQVRSVPEAVQIKSAVPVVAKSRQPHHRQPVSAIAHAPVYRDAYQQALLSLRTGRVSEAHAQLRERLREAPQDLAACRLLASLLLDSGQQAEAAEVLAAGLALSPQSTDLALSLARLQADQGQLASALKTLETSAGSTAQNADYIVFMAVLAAQTGQAQRAISLWQQALQLEPEHGVWWLALGASQQTVQDRVGARLSFEKALASAQLDDAQQRRARKALAQLRD